MISVVSETPQYACRSLLPTAVALPAAPDQLGRIGNGLAQDLRQLAPSLSQGASVDDRNPGLYYQNSHTFGYKVMQDLHYLQFIYRVDRSPLFGVNMERTTCWF